MIFPAKRPEVRLPPTPGSQASSAKSFGRSANATYKYITDNPYRLLSLGSSEPPRTVRQKAVAATQAAKVGLPTNVSLQQEFGDQELARCDELARQIASLPIPRTLYRQMWPYVLPRQTSRIDSSTELVESTFEQGERAEFFGVQLDFLRHWFLFLGNDQPSCIASALDCFGRLYDDDLHEDYLCNALKYEGEEPDTAHNAVVEAQNELALHLLRFASERATHMLDRRDYTAFEIAVQSIWGCSLDHRIVHQALSEVVVPYGNRAMERAQGAVRDSQDSISEVNWSPEWEVYSGEDVQSLFELAKLPAAFPSAPLWRQAAQQRVDQVALAMFRQAVTLASTHKEYKLAQSLIKRVRALPISLELEEHIKLQADLLTAKDQKQTDPRGAVPRPINAAPMLFTWNGFGTKLYGNDEFPPHPAWYKATLYLTVLFLPIFPIKHYLVSNADRGRTNFHASLPFHIGHKIHLALGAVVALVIVYNMAIAPPSTYSEPGTTVLASSDSAPSDSATTNTDSPDTSDNTPQNTALAAQAQSLKQQLDVQLSHLQVEKREVESEQSALHAQFARWQQMHNQVDANRKIVNAYDPDAIASFNAMVEKANAVLADYNVAVVAGHLHIKAYNTEADMFRIKEQHYDSMVEQLNSGSSQ